MINKRESSVFAANNNKKRYSVGANIVHNNKLSCPSIDNSRDSFESITTTDTTFGRILVAVRIRPLSSKEKSSGIQSCVQVIGDSIVAIKKSGDTNGYLKSQQTAINEYAFDVAFDETSTQSEVFERTAQSFISNVIEGQNVTVFAYGATGAGKTHTMLGNTRADEAASHAEAGIIPNSVKDLLEQVNLKQQSQSFGETWSVSLNFMEVYNEQVYDLLESTGKVLSVREDQERGVVIAAGLTEQTVTSYDEVMELLQQGNKNRKTEATMANAVSSRSHAVLQLTVKHTKRLNNGKESFVESKLSLIDLAGSERASATNNRGARLHEGANINKSLLALANCINTLAENSSTGKKLNVKYRDSKLTHLLKSSLEGNCNLIMIANINPADNTFEDSHNTLKYANRAKNIKIQPNVTKEVTKESNWIERESRLMEENQMLRERITELEELVMNLQNFKNNVIAQSDDAICDNIKDILSTSVLKELSDSSMMDDQDIESFPYIDNLNPIDGSIQSDEIIIEEEVTSTTDKKRRISSIPTTKNQCKKPRNTKESENDSSTSNLLINEKIELSLPKPVVVNNFVTQEQENDENKLSVNPPKRLLAPRRVSTSSIQRRSMAGAISAMLDSITTVAQEPATKQTPLSTIKDEESVEITNSTKKVTTRSKVTTNLSQTTTGMVTRRRSSVGTSNVSKSVDKVTETVTSKRKKESKENAAVNRMEDENNNSHIWIDI